LVPKASGSTSSQARSSSSSRPRPQPCGCRRSSQAGSARCIGCGHPRPPPSWCPRTLGWAASLPQDRADRGNRLLRVDTRDLADDRPAVARNGNPGPRLRYGV